VARVDVDQLHDPAALFRHVAGEGAPLKSRNLADVERPLPAPLPRKREEDEREVLREALESPLTFEDRLDTGDEAAYLRVGLPRRVLTDLRRGRWVVQAELDLHGLTRDEARASLAHFIALSLQQGRRCLRVIHGKGHGSPGRLPVLKHLSRGWLAQREDILAFCQARPHDGGEGALLVLLQAGGAPRA
jgi:DNA-nicking Smr family endonuclease